MQHSDPRRDMQHQHRYQQQQRLRQRWPGDVVDLVPDVCTYVSDCSCALKFVLSVFLVYEIRYFAHILLTVIESTQVMSGSKRKDPDPVQSSTDESDVPSQLSKKQVKPPDHSVAASVFSVGSQLSEKKEVNPPEYSVAARVFSVGNVERIVAAAAGAAVACPATVTLFKNEKTPGIYHVIETCRFGKNSPVIEKGNMQQCVLCTPIARAVMGSNPTSLHFGEPCFKNLDSTALIKTFSVDEVYEVVDKPLLYEPCTLCRPTQDSAADVYGKLHQIKAGIRHIWVIEKVRSKELHNSKQQLRVHKSYTSCNETRQIPMLDLWTTSELADNMLELRNRDRPYEVLFCGSCFNTPSDELEKIYYARQFNHDASREFAVRITDIVERMNQITSSIGKQTQSTCLGEVDDANKSLLFLIEECQRLRLTQQNEVQLCCEMHHKMQPLACKDGDKCMYSLGP